ncbi:hypothetical protein Tco_1533016 [Tanacetum coccineum]
MSNMSEDIQYAGSDTRPPMLDRTDFESWQQPGYCLTDKESVLIQCDAIDSDVIRGSTTTDHVMIIYLCRYKKIEYYEVHECKAMYNTTTLLTSDTDYTSEVIINVRISVCGRNEEHVLQSNVSAIQNDALMSIEDDMQEQGTGRVYEQRKKAETSVPKPISALTVYPPNTPVKLVPRILPTKSQVKINLYITRAHTSEKTSTMLNEIESLKAQLRSKVSCFTSDSVKPKVLAPGMYAIDELLEYVIGTCPKSFNERDNKAPSTPVTRKKQVTFSDKPGTSSSNTQKHEVHQKVQQTNIPVIPSTGVNTSTEASGSKPRSNTKKNRILPAKRENKKKVEDHLRTNKSVWTKVNRVDSSISYRRVVINSNSESVCKMCNKCLNSANHEMCVVNILSSVNATPTVKIVLNKGKQIWKPKGKLSDNSLNKTKRVWKATGKLFADIGYQWRPTGKKFTLGKLDCGYQWRPTGKKFALGEMCPLTKPSVKCCSKHMTGNRSKLKNFVEKFIGTVRFGNDHFGAIMGYGDYVIGDSVISRVYYVEGLGHNLFSVGQFCDSDLESIDPTIIVTPGHLKQGRPTDKELEMYSTQFCSPCTSLSTTIAQDVPSTSASSSTSDMHPPVLHQGIAEEPTLEDSLITHDSLHPTFNHVTREPGSAESSSRNVNLTEPNQVTQPPDHLRKW